MSNKKQAVLICALLIIALVSLASIKISSSGIHLETDVLSLLPADEKNREISLARKLLSGESGRVALFLLSTDDYLSLKEAHKTFANHFASTNSAFDLFLPNQTAIEDISVYYLPFIYQWLTESNRELLRGISPESALARSVQKQLFSDTSVITSRFLEKDPLLFGPDLLRQGDFSPKELEFREGMLVRQVDDKWFSFIPGAIKGNPYREDVQLRAENTVRDCLTTFHQKGLKVQLDWTSPLKYASSARSSIKGDIRIIGGGSMIGIVALILLALGSIRYLWVALIPIFVGVLGGLVVCLLVFSKLHVITVVFGASLVGVCIDYCLHFFSYHRSSRQWNASRSMRNLLPTMLFGMFTTVLGYAAIGLSPLVGLRQLSVFACSGVCFAFLVTYLLSPVLLAKPNRYSDAPSKLFRLWGGYLGNVLEKKKKYCFIGFIILSVCLFGLLRFHVDDSPKALNSLPSRLVYEERKINEITGNKSETGMIIVNGMSHEALLQNMEKLDRQLFLTPDVPIVDGILLNRFIPSQKTQKQDYNLLRNLNQPALISHLIEIGFSQTLLDSVKALFNLPYNENLSLDSWLNNNHLFEGLKQNYLGKLEGRHLAIVPLTKIMDQQVLEEKLGNMDFASLYRPIRDTTRVLSQYRLSVTYLLILAFSFVLLALMARYKKRALFVFLPTLLACVCAIGILGWIKVPFNLIHLIGFLLVLGLGVDYSIFLADSSASHITVSYGAITLSALTTALSFGLLGLSSQAVLQALGLTTFLGTFFAWLFAPLARLGMTE